jgi:probable rRNA maturation factor
MSRAAERLAPVLALDLQLATAPRLVPDSTLFEAAARAALTGHRRRAELTIRVVGRAESRALNRRYRGVDKATNVLSFPAEGIAAVAPDFLGDIAICAALVRAEAKAQGKLPEAHWTHLVVHGVLHLLGYDHLEDSAARIMEDIERASLSRLGLPDPYEA